MAYFDNASTTYPKPDIVYTYMDSFYRNSGVNAMRGNYKLAQNAMGIIAETRELIQDCLNCPSKQVVFTPTATIALNIILQGLIKKGARNIYITPFEHNAVTRILHYYQDTKDIDIHQLTVSNELHYDLERIKYQFENVKPDVVITTHASNVIGLIAPIEDIFCLAKQYGAYTVADMAQTAGLVDCNVGLDTFDFAVFAGHKTLYGPTGISGFVQKPDLRLPPVIFGGTGIDSANPDMPDALPERYEMGTLNISGIAGLNAALKWRKDTGEQVILAKENANRTKLISLLNKYDWVHLVGNTENNEYVGIVSCLFDGLSSDMAGNVLGENGIDIRAGLQCAPMAHKFLGTFPAGTLRFSVGYFTNDKDFNKLESAMDYIEGEL